jgi:hypothetical protein
VPSCYLLTVCGGSSLDQHSNNVTLFNLVEQINFPPGATPPRNRALPLEVHAYFTLLPHELAQPFEVRFAMVASSGLETLSDVFSHKSHTPRYRTRTLGLPFPPVTDQYQLRVDWRQAGTDGWRREPAHWPINFVEAAPTPTVKH